MDNVASRYAIEKLGFRFLGGQHMFRYGRWRNHRAHRYAEPRLVEALADSPVLLIHGPRQCGKTTLARMADDPRGYSHFTFDDDVTLAAARADPVGFVGDLPERTILDEVRRTPGLFAALEASVDRQRTQEEQTLRLSRGGRSLGAKTNSRSMLVIDDLSALDGMALGTLVDMHLNEEGQAGTADAVASRRSDESPPRTGPERAARIRG